VRITLPVHPWCGQEVLVLAARGEREVHAELPDGRRCYLPLVWTDRHPRRVAEMVGGVPVRLTVTGVRSLAVWISDRRKDRQKLDSADRDAEKSHDEIVERPAAAVAVVGEARASGIERAARRRKRRQGQ
jgi:hypothetical protein